METYVFSVLFRKTTTNNGGIILYEWDLITRLRALASWYIPIMSELLHEG